VEVPDDDLLYVGSVSARSSPAPLPNVTVSGAQVNTRVDGPRQPVRAGSAVPREFRASRRQLSGGVACDPAVGGSGRCLGSCHNTLSDCFTLNWRPKTSSYAVRKSSLLRAS
jgi:hypothetical protein